MSEQQSLASSHSKSPDNGPGFASQLRSALLIVWIVLSLVGMAILLLPFFLDSSTLVSALPRVDVWHTSGEPCALCGMTRAFYCISAGEWATARAYNSNSWWLFGVLLVNGLWCAGFWLRRWMKRR